MEDKQELEKIHQEPRSMMDFLRERRNLVQSRFRDYPAAPDQPSKFVAYFVRKFAGLPPK
jgi:hypothetical protein